MGRLRTACMVLGILALCWGLGGVSGQDGQETPHQDKMLGSWVEQLKNDDGEARRSAASALVRVAPKDRTQLVAPLLELLKSDAVDTRQLAAYVLGNIRPPAGQVIPPLFEALTDKEPSVRRSAAVALIQVGVRAKKKLLPPLAAAFKSDEADTRLLAIYILNNVDPDFDDAARMLQDLVKDRNQTVRHEARAALKIFDPDNPALAETLPDKEAPKRSGTVDVPKEVRPKPIVRGEWTHTIVTEKARRIEGILSFQFRSPTVQAKEWVLLLPCAPQLVRQDRVSTTMKPEAAAVVEKGPLSRRCLLSRISVQKPEQAEGFSASAVYRATLYSRNLKVVRSESARPDAALSVVEKSAYLTATDALDFKSTSFQNWLDAHQLRKRDSQTEIDFARQVYRTIRGHHTYYGGSDQERTVSKICTRKGSSCVGLGMLYTAALRANGVPARTLWGRWAVTARPDSKLNGEYYGNWHTKSEFFAEDVGWVPVDMSGALEDKTGDEYKYFGTDDGHFLVMHVDTDMMFDIDNSGSSRRVPWARDFFFWYKARGSVDNGRTDETWLVREIQ